jgi:hypothetical protein
VSQIDPIVLLAALGGGAGVSAVLQATGTVIAKIRRGVSPREGKRRVDIVQQRDEALLRLDQATERADWADANRLVAVANEQRAREHAAELRVQLIAAAGISRDELPDWPDMHRTNPREEFHRLRREGQA